MKKRQLKAVVTAIAFTSFSASAAVLPAHQLSDTWFVDGAKTVESKVKTAQNTNQAKNIILFVGDGMGVSTQTAARILEGQNKKMPGGGEENFLSFETFSNSALIKTYNTNQQTPDSAGTMTAMATGIKTKAGVLNIAPDALRADCKSARGNELTSVMQFAESKGLSTGVVSTARITHATPAATYARTPERNWEYNVPVEEAKYGCKDIATQFVEFSAGDGIDVAFGGGRRNFFPKGIKDIEGKSGKRTDGIDLRELWKKNNKDGVYVEDQAGFNKIPANANKVFGLFNSSHMQYEADRKNDKAGEPSLTEMTKKAIALLKARSGDKGFVLVVESGRIDHGHHAGSAYNALTDTIEYANAVKAAKEMTGNDTLIMVTADHSHVFTMAGYPTRGNPILGKVIENDANGISTGTYKLASDKLPYTTLGYTNGLGFRNLGDNMFNADASYANAPDTGRKDLTKVNTLSPGFHQEALVPMGSETHAGEDVTLHAMGPGAAYVQGVMEQNAIFHVINKALGLDAK